MSNFKRFMKENKIPRENEKYAPTKSLVDEEGEPLEWEFRHIGSKENEDIRESCTFEVQVTGKPNLFRPKLNSPKYLVETIVKATVFPDLYDKELQDSYGVKTPQELVYAMVDDAGEYNKFSAWMSEFQGFESMDEKVKKAKNS